MIKAIKKSIAVVSLAALPVVSAQAGGGDNHAAVFLGATKAYSGTNPTAGIEYERRLPFMDRKIGLGVVAERIFDGGYQPDLVLGGVVIHPWKDLKFNISAGKEFLDSHSKNVVRVGAGYDLHYNNISYGPVYNIDTISGKRAHVFGLAIGMGF